ncbi:MAG: hypothetical protein GTO40_03785 [Deltaproteobacteria bacterium]|nr:hypothetical protein [Deltaproteobacteria bacterium]
MKTAELPDQTFRQIALELKRHTAEDPTVAVQAADGGIQLLFAVVRGSD